MLSFKSWQTTLLWMIICILLEVSRTLSRCCVGIKLLMARRGRHFTNVFLGEAVPKIWFLRGICHSCSTSLKKISSRSTTWTTRMKSLVNGRSSYCTCGGLSNEETPIINIALSSDYNRRTMFVHVSSSLTDTLSWCWVTILVMKHCYSISLIFFSGQPNRMEIVLSERATACHSWAHSDLRELVLGNTWERMLLKVWTLMMSMPCCSSELLRETQLRFAVNSIQGLHLTCSYNVWVPASHARDSSVRQHDTATSIVIACKNLLVLCWTKATGIIFHRALKWLLGICVIKGLIQDTVIY